MEQLPESKSSEESIRPIGLQLIAAATPAVGIAAATAGIVAIIDPSLLLSRADNGLAIAAVAGLAVATVVFAIRLLSTTLNLGIVSLAERERRSMWEAMDELEQAVDK